MAKRNISNEPKRLNMNAPTTRIIPRLKNGLSRLISSICGFFLVRNKTTTKSPINANIPAANSTGWIILSNEFNI